MTRVCGSSGTSARRGSAAARNTGLELCRGELIAYLDDDNLMGRRGWRALIWAFDLHPEADVVYGALLHQENGQEPELHFEPFDRRRLELANVADQSAIAHAPRSTRGRTSHSITERTGR